MTTIIKVSDGKTAPGPTSNFLQGSMADIHRDQLGFYAELREKYGDVVRFRVIGNVFAYLIFHPDDIDYVLRRHNQNYGRGIAHRRFKMMLGDGLLTSEGKSWLQERRLMQPAFHRQRIASLTSVMTKAATSMLERWQCYSDSERSFDVSAEMMRLTLQIAGLTLFSSDISGEADKIGRAMTISLDQINYELSHLTFPMFVPLPRNIRYRKALRTLDDVVYEIIKTRRQNEKDTGDLLSMLMFTRDEETGEGMSDKQLRDEVMTLMLAGHETTANTLTWTWYLLAQHPEIERKLHKELTNVLGGRTPTLEDLSHLTYTKLIIDEVLRLYPPSWGMSRKVVADDVIRGYRIPAGSEIGLVQYVTQRHPNFWNRPEVFDPERFTPERSAGRPHFAYFPFGGGPRLCIGNTFALMEAPLILATVAQRYKLCLDPAHPVKPVPLVTLRPDNGVFMYLQEQNMQYINHDST